MKLSGRDATAYFRNPQPDRTGLLIFGEDSMRVALRRADVLRALLGESAEEEMRLTRMSGSDLRSEAAPLIDAMKAIGFFPGPRAVFVEGATETTAPAITAALEDWRDGDAQIVVTAGALKATSKLRKLFEDHRNCVAIGLYDDPPSRQEVEEILAEQNLRNVPQPTMNAILDLSRELTPGDFRQTIEKVGLYKLGDETPLTEAEVALSAPSSNEAAVDKIIDIVADGQPDAIGPMLARLTAQGVAPVTICIFTLRHFSALHAAASDPSGPSAALSRARPPIFGPRRDKMIRQAQAWGVHRSEDALHSILEADLKLRSAGQHAPAMALVERMLIRLAMMTRRK